MLHLRGSASTRANAAAATAPTAPELSGDEIDALFAASAEDSEPVLPGLSYMDPEVASSSSPSSLPPSSVSDSALAASMVARRTAAVSARSAASARPIPVEEYFHLTDADIAPSPSIDEPESESRLGSFDTPHPEPASVPLSYDAALRTPRRRRRRKDERALPPLPPGTVPDADRTRFDWRGTALSQSARAEGGYWFPDAFRRRVMPPITKVNEVEPLHAEIGRYAQHFVPLLLAEQEEAEAQFNARLREWPDDRLKREGYMLDELGGSAVWQPRFTVEGMVVTFARLGKAATRPLTGHQFEPGQTVLLSRTDPLDDPATDDEGQPLRGTVFSKARGHIRVLFPSLPDHLETGLWRIDIGCSDFAIKRQREAIDRLNLDPVAQDMAGAAAQPQPVLNSKIAPEDEALLAQQKRRKPNTEQAVLVGTGLRDLLLRRFQADYDAPGDALPLDEREVVHEAEAGAVVAGVTATAAVETDVESEEWSDAAKMAPSDVDATLSPSQHTSAAPRGIIAANQLINSWAQRYRTPEGVAPLAVEGDPEVPLNASQTRAIAMMLSERLSLVQGPPGTGKTRVIVETIRLLKEHWKIPHPILVCAHTNVAVDNLLDGLVGRGLKALRFGTAVRVPEHLQEHTFEAALERHPLWSEMERLKNERERVQERMSQQRVSKHAKETLQKTVNQLNGRMYFMRKRVQFEVLADADVICTTCLSATSRLLDAVDFPFVFLDEASMATEPLSLVPLTKGSAQVAIIGDHKQLPPVIVSEEAQAGGLATSLFERLIHEKHVPSIMLDTQYRMHPSISSFASRTFYNSLLKDGTVFADGRVRPDLVPPETAFLVENEHGERQNVTFLNHSYPESPQHRSIANYHEAGRVCDIVADLLASNPGLKGADIGVIAPYAAQIRVISEFLHVDPQRAAAFSSWLGDRAEEVGDIEVRTVDGFEGREKDVIIFSTTRSNPAGYVGFLADWRRLNVGLTRAKRGLVILGSAGTLERARIGKSASEALPRDGAKVWRDFVAHLRKEGLVMDDPA